jgi:hypothetical protein
MVLPNHIIYLFQPSSQANLLTHITCYHIIEYIKYMESKVSIFCIPFCQTHSSSYNQVENHPTKGELVMRFLKVYMG